MTTKIGALLEVASIDLFSDIKEKRVAARQALLDLTESFQTIPKLAKKELDEMPNWTWLMTAVTETCEEKCFPYRINPAKAGEIFRKNLIDQKDIPERTHKVSEKPAYLINMAHVSKPKNKNPVQPICQQIELLQAEGFASTQGESLEDAKERLRIVVGVNYCYSIDSERNKAHKKYLGKISDLFIKNVRFIGFSWKPVWQNTDGEQVSDKEPKRFFRLIKECNAEVAEEIFKEVMDKKVVPYQFIRETIKEHPYTQSFLKNLRHGRKNRPCFFVTWDDDAVKVRTTAIGLFSHYDKLIEDHPDARILTTGYYMAQEGCAYIELASRLDYIARSAIGATLASYPPEPNMIVAIQPEYTVSETVSFLRKGSERGKSLEAIGVLEHLNLLKGSHHGQIVFGEEGAIETSVSPKVKIPKKLLQAKTMDINNFEQVRSLRSFYLSALRGTTFASLVCRSLPTGCGSQTIKGKVAALLGLFDPIEYIRSFNDWQDLYPFITKKLLKFYKKFKENKEWSPLYKNQAEKIKRVANANKDSSAQIATFLKWGNTTLQNIHQELKEHKVSSANIRLLVEITEHTGEQLFQFLKEN